MQTPVQTSAKKHAYLQVGSNPVCAFLSKPLLSGGFFLAASSRGGDTRDPPPPIYGLTRESSVLHITIGPRFPDQPAFGGCRGSERVQLGRSISANRAAPDWAARVLLLCQGGTRFEGVVDDADEEPFEAADRFAAALAFGAFAFEVVACGRVVAGLCDRDSVERGVELAVAAAVESVALDPA